MNDRIRYIIAFWASLCISGTAFCQVDHQTFFVEGFHGGVYGHYPLNTYTTYMMDLSEKHPEWKFSIEIEPETWDSVKVADPVGYERFRKAAIDGSKVEFTNPSYAQPYCYNISGESIIRQFEYGIRTLNRHFPGIRFDSYAVEEPCFTSALPQILKGFGFSYASIKNPNTTWGGYSAPHGGEIVRWISPDGSWLLASPRHEIEKLGKSVWETEANGLYPSYYKSAFDAGFKHPVGMCYQDAGWKFGLWLEHGKADNRHTVRYVTWREYFSKVATDVKPEDYRYHQEDIRGGLVWGSQVLQRLAREVREAENGITSAEKIGSIAFLSNGYRYDQAEVDEAWRCLLLSQHHDSWIVPYNNLKNKGCWADWICDRWTATTDRVAAKVTAEAIASLAPQVNSSSSLDSSTAAGPAAALEAGPAAALEAGPGPAPDHAVPTIDAGPLRIRVYNTTGNARKEVVSLKLNQIHPCGPVTLTNSFGEAVECYSECVEGENTLVFMADAPAFGYSTYSLTFEKGPAVPALEKGPAVAEGSSTPGQVTTIENDMYRITFDPQRGGTITSLYSKTDGCEFVANDTLAFGEMRGFFYDEGRFLSSADSPATVRIVEDNALEKKVNVNGSIGPHPFCQTITLRKGSGRIDIGLTIFWKGNPGIGAYRQGGEAYKARERCFYDESGKLNISFPSVAAGGRLFKNAPFDVCETRLSETRFTDYDHIKHNIILNWVDLEGNDGRSISLLSDHTTAYVNGGKAPLGLTLQYSGSGLWGRNYKIDRPTEVRLALVPHTGGWAVTDRENRHWTEPLVAVLAPGATVEDRGYIDLLDSGYEICAAHPVEGGVLVRLYNAAGDGSEQKIALDPSITRVTEVDLNGNPIRVISIHRAPAKLAPTRVTRVSANSGGVISVKMPRFGFRSFVVVTAAER